MFDALTARAIAAELQNRIGRGRVQAVVGLSELSLGLEVYAHHARENVYTSAEPSTARVQLVEEKLRSSGKLSLPILLLLKKYARGAIVGQVEAVPLERIIRIRFDHPEQGVSILVIELMGRHSNLILLDAEGHILDAIKRVTPAMRRARSVLPGNKYLPPPPQSKLNPLTMQTADLAQLIRDRGGEPLYQVLVQSVAATSPLLAREIAFRVTGRADAPANTASPESVRRVLAEVWTAPPDPTIAFEAESPIDFAAYALTHLPKTEHVSSISSAMDRVYGSIETYGAVKQSLQRRLEEAHERARRKLASLKRELVSAEEIERLRLSGEFILAYQSTIAPLQKTLSAERVEGSNLTIKLDPALTPVENAQRYFAEYRKAKESAAAVPSRLAEAEADTAFVEQVIQDLEMAETRGEIDDAVTEATEAGLLDERRKRQMTAGPSGPREFVSPDGFQILVGRNARQNEWVTFERAGPDDLWLHARQAAGAHVVILSSGHAVPDSTIEVAASLAAYYSQGREDTRVDVTVTPRKNVRRVSGRAARPGLVTVRGERTVRVRPGLPETGA